eukprot:3946502-Pleurochrysis_carterae.AAC.3
MKLLLLVSALAALVAPAAAWSPATGLPMRTRAVAVTPSMLARDGSTDLSIDEPCAIHFDPTAHRFQCYSYAQASHCTLKDVVTLEAARDSFATNAW